MVEEGAAQALRRAAGAGTFDGVHRGAMGLRCRHEAGADLRAVEQHGAGAAIAGVAADLGSGEAEPVAQEIGERLERRRLDEARLAVERERNRERRRRRRGLMDAHAALRAAVSARLARKSRVSASAAARR